MNYVHITDNVVDFGPEPLPQVTDNINGPHLLSDPELAVHGWYPVQETDPPYDPDTQVREGPVDTWDPDSKIMTRVYSVRNMNATEQDQTLADKQTAQVSVLRQSAAAVSAAEFVSNVLGTAHRYNVDQISQSKLTAIAASAIRNQAAPAWKRKLLCTPDGQSDWRRRDHDATQIMDLGDELIDHLATIEDTLEAKIDQVMAVTIATDLATAISEVEAITW